MVGECGFGFFNCSAGGCIDVNLVCDGTNDCLEDGDNSDEEGCRKLRLCEREGKREREREREGGGGRGRGREREREGERAIHVAAD